MAMEKRVMTMEEFKSWLLMFDYYQDGKISREELQEVIKISGGRFTRWKSSRAIRSVDSNGDGNIDDNEMSSLVDFAKKHLGIKIVAC